MGQLLHLLDAAEGGESQLAVIRGPAGIGKTRLAEELLERARARGARVAFGRCWADGEAPPLWPWRSILRELGAAESLVEEDDGGRFARFLAVLDFLRGRGPTPTVAVVDDAHLADAATLLLVRFLMRERGLPLLLLVTHRDEARPAEPEVGDLLAELDAEAVALPLSGLSTEAMRAYLAAAGVGEGGEEALQAVAAVTRGNPLHLRSVTLQSALAPSGLRGGLEHAVAGLVDRLPAHDRQLIAQAALLDRQVAAHEVARLGGVPPALAVEALARAAARGLLLETGDGRFTFAHDLVRQAAAAALSTSEVLDAHARAAALLGGPEPDVRLRRAHHALAAAGRSRDDAALAVEAARGAARTLRAGDGFEASAHLLARALDVHAAAALDVPSAGPLVEWAESVLVSGRLTEAHALFHRAARAAEAEGDPAALARAAIGLGGLWVGEHRLRDEAGRVRALQERALAGLPADAAVLRTRLSVRLAAEDVYRGGSEAPLLEGLAAARKSADAHALAEALSLCHHALFTPEHIRRRLVLADELIAAAARAGDGLLSLLGLCWRAADLFLLGHRDARGALEELRFRADAVRSRSMLFVARAMDVMLAIRAARFEEAEALAAACFALGNEVGDADALPFHCAQLMAIRVFQGREGELVSLAASISASPTVFEGREHAFALAACLFELRAGHPRPARGLLDRLGREGLGSIAMSSSWLTAVLVVVELAAALGDAGAAAAAYDALLPHADLPLMASLAVVCFGSVQRALGVAALTCGRAEHAVGHLEAAVTANEALGHRPAAVQARAELALALLRRARAGDAARGAALLDDACAAALALGMGGLAARWRPEAPAPAPRPPGAGRAVRMSAAGSTRWRLTLGEQVATVPHRVGMRYLALLLAAPDQDVAALTLVIGEPAPEPARGADPVLDIRALKALRDRLRTLRARPLLSLPEEEELEHLTRELARASGLGGRVRSFADAPERARTAVRKALKRAIEEITAANPAIGAHLAERIRTGSVCRYGLAGAEAGERG